MSSFKEFLEKNKWIPSGGAITIAEVEHEVIGEQVSVRALGEWALEKLIYYLTHADMTCDKIPNSFTIKNEEEWNRFKFDIQDSWDNPVGSLYFQIACVCLGESVVRERLEELK